MAYDEVLAERIRALIGPDPELTEKKMFGGLALPTMTLTHILSGLFPWGRSERLVLTVPSCLTVGYLYPCGVMQPL